MAAENLYFSDKALAQRFGVTRTTIWRWVQDSRFPKPIKLSKGCTRWRLSDIEKWEDARDEEG